MPAFFFILVSLCALCAAFWPLWLVFGCGGWWLYRTC